MTHRPLFPRTPAVRLMVGGLMLMLAACSTTSVPTATAPAGPDHAVLSAVEFDLLPGWHDDAMAQAIPAMRRSCAYLSQLPPGQLIGFDGRGGLAGDWLEPCGALRRVADGDNVAARAYFESWFTAYRVSNGPRAEGLFTGYFEPELHGSRRPGGRYQVPLYGRPPGWPADPADSGETYFSRADIEGGALRGRAPELLWVDDPVDAHILQIQGSGRIVLDDGSVVRVGFNGSNGRNFVGLGRILLDHGKIAPGDTTMQTVRAWLKSHPAEAPGLMAENPRYVFFRLLSGDGPIGAEGVPLTPGRSLAVDRRYIPLGAPMWLVTTEPDGRPMRRLMVAQDAGKAIKGPVRGDVFWGAGDAAFDKAGRMKSQGSYFLLLPRKRSVPVAMAVSAPTRL